MKFSKEDIETIIKHILLSNSLSIDIRYKLMYLLTNELSKYKENEITDYPIDQEDELDEHEYEY